jgi:starch phosphorylase
MSIANDTRVKVSLLAGKPATPAMLVNVPKLNANGVNGAAPERVEMKRVRQLVGAINGYAYHAQVPATRPATDYAARVIPLRNGVAVPLEEAHILWQR